MLATIAAVFRSSKRVARVKGALPWAALLRLATVGAKRWRALSAKERARLGNLVRASRGRPGNLSKGERRELRKLLGKLDLAGAGRELMGVLRGGGRGRLRKRR